MDADAVDADTVDAVDADAGVTARPYPYLHFFSILHLNLFSFLSRPVLPLSPKAFPFLQFAPAGSLAEVNQVVVAALLFCHSARCTRSPRVGVRRLLALT